MFGLNRASLRNDGGAPPPPLSRSQQAETPTPPRRPPAAPQATRPPSTKQATRGQTPGCLVRVGDGAAAFFPRWSYSADKSSNII